VIVAAAGKPVAGPSQMVDAVEANGVGRPMALKVMRGGTPVQLEVVPTGMESGRRQAR
jgi:S1-C subfamily serine protease